MSLKVRKTSKTDDQLKDDLIKEKLISNKLLKMKTKLSKVAKMRIKKEKCLNSDSEVKKEPTLIMTNASDENTTSTDEKSDMTDVECQERKEELIAKKIKKKKEAWQVSDNKAEGKNGLQKDASKNDIANGDKSVTRQKSESKLNGGKFVTINQKVKKNPTLIKKLKQKNSGNIKSKSVNQNKAVANGKTKIIDKKKKASRMEVVVKEEEEEEEDEESPPPLSRAASGRKKRARKIFDPADHDLPGRLLKKSRSSTAEEETKEVKEIKEVKEVKEVKVVKEVKEAKESKESKEPVKETKETKDAKAAEAVGQETRGSRQGSRRKVKSVVPVVPEQEPCLYCDGGDRRNERLISCKDCKTTVHPSCLNYPEDLTDQIYSQVATIFFSDKGALRSGKVGFADKGPL